MTTTVTRANSRLKFADGPGNDLEFEEAFANLAFAYMRDKAPGLLDFMLGFQLIERDDENYRAVGVFGFKVGSQMLYAPVFYVKGKMKGNELLYLADQDMLVPRSEKWINYIVNRKPMVLGDRVTRNARELGVKQPDLSRLREPPSKTASAYPEWLRPGIAGLARKLLTMPNQRSLLGDFLKVAGMNSTGRLVKTAMVYPQFAQALKDFGRLPEIAEAIAIQKQKMQKQGSVMSMLRQPQPTPYVGSVLAKLQQPAPRKTASVKVLEYRFAGELDAPAAKDLSEDAKEKLLRDSFLVVDNRKDDEVSKAYRVQTTQTLSSPTETGIYDVFLQSGQFAKSLVVHQPVVPGGKPVECVVIRLEASTDGRHPTFTEKVSDVLIGKQYTTAEWKSWFNGLPGSIESSKKNRYVAITPNGRSTGIFKINAKSPDADSYSVDFEYFCGCSGSYDTMLNLKRPAGTRLRAMANAVYVPEDAKFFKVRGPSEWESDTSGPETSGDSAFRAGAIEDLDFALSEKTASLKIYCDGSEAIINGGQRTSAKTALFSLIRDHGFREDTAASLLKLADARPTNTDTFRVKYANPYGLQGQGASPEIPEPLTGPSPFGDSQYTSQYSQEQLQPVQGMQMAEPGDYNQLDPQAVQQVMQAAESGGGEAFDVSAINQLLDTNEDRTISEGMGRLMGGMDELGRQLLQVYWRPDQYAEKYGKAALPKLEDAMQQTFEKMGTIVLQLKQQQVAADPAMDLANIDIGSASE
jgi:hypothetical protein